MIHGIPQNYNLNDIYVRVVIALFVFVALVALLSLALYIFALFENRKNIKQFLAASKATLFSNPSAICGIIRQKISRISVRKLQNISIAILFLDLLGFNAYGLITRHFVFRDYGDFLKKEGVIETKIETSSIDSREPFPLPKIASFPPDGTFFGYEIYSVKKCAFPFVVLHTFLKQTSLESYKEDAIPECDHFYMTKYYYDYLVNVNLIKQLATSSVLYPIINFFPKENVIFCEDKYEVVKRINQSNMEDLGKYIFVEKTKKIKPILSKVNFFNPKNFLSYTQKDVADFKKYVSIKHLGEKGTARFTLKSFNVNKLDLNVNIPTNGYFFFGDGYSKYWKAFVDGKEAKIEKTNINFKSVFVTRGQHNILFVYDPALFRYSLYLYFLGNLIAVAILGIYLFKFRSADLRRR